MSSSRRVEVPFVDLMAGYLAQKEEIDLAIEGVMAHSDFILGDSVERFERDFASYCGTSEAIGCGNGTDALELVLQAAGIGAGDEVITASHTFAATVAAIFRVGATPVLIDVDDSTLLMDGSLLEEVIGVRTAAIIAVHLYGSCVAMNPVQTAASKHGLLLIEDSAQAHGAQWNGRRAGSIGDVATFSFYPSKNLGALGDAGAITTNDLKLAESIRMLRDHGKSGKFTHETVGRNSRLDGLQAAVLSVKLTRLDEDNAARRVAFRRYQQDLSARELAARLVEVPRGVEAVHHLSVVRVSERNEVMAALKRDGIGCGIHYPIPTHKQAAFREARTPLPLPVTERACSEIVSLPMWPQISPREQAAVLESLTRALDN